MIVTVYSPPRRQAMNMQDLISLARRPLPTYFFADLNAQHTLFGYGRANNMGNILAALIQRNILTYLGPDFKTRITAVHATTPDIALGNRYANLNIALQQGPMSSSDHLPMYIRLATKPITIRGRKVMKIKKIKLGIISEVSH